VGVRYTSSESNEKTIDLSVSQVEDEVYVFIQFESPLPNEILLAVQEILMDEDEDKLPQSVELGPNLSIACGYIDLHKGKVSVKNDHESGCEFTIILPTVNNEAT
ncbi:MAG: hypothetical protein GY943_09295, partial [Chloroflexi bacterium]|nr:hypothetical protein [Chloroflexota bacterium]